MENNPSPEVSEQKYLSFKRFWWVMVLLLLLLIGAVLIIAPKPARDSQGTSQSSGAQTENTTANKETAERPVFTHKIFETDKVKYIVPLGELNGGYIELQTLNSVMVQLDNTKVKNSPIEVFAPTDMELINYAHTVTDDQPNGDWNLEFKINDDYALTIHHLNNAGEKIVAQVGNATKKDDSRSIDVKPPIKFKAGELIGTTRGTSLGNNWNVYLYDKTVENKFINQTRYKSKYLGERLLTSVCPFDYYGDQTVKDAYYALLGASKPGQSKTCGNPSKDKTGTLSGLWHLQQTGIETNYDGNYANPFSLYIRSDGNVIIYELGKHFYTIPSSAKTYKNPESITTSHCFNLADDWGNSYKQGYAYFRLDSETEMSAVYSATGSCPAEFPSSNAKKYYR